MLTFETSDDFSGEMEIVLTKLSIKVSGGSNDFTPGASVFFSSESLAGEASPADFDGDAKVDFDDFFALADAFGKKIGEPGFDEKFDMVDNGEIDFDDFFAFAEAFGQANRQ